MRDPAWFTGILISLLFLILCTTSLIGQTSRRFARERIVSNIERGGDAFIFWNNLDLHGRVLIFFDRHLNAGKIPETEVERILLSANPRDVNENNFIYLSLRAGILRKIYHVIPESSWPEVSAALSSYSIVATSGNQFRFTVDGTPIIVTRTKDLPLLREKVLVYFNLDYVDAYGRKSLSEYVDDRQRADVVLLTMRSGQK
jgi:hypothetical protein